ncbi:hypothetical protein KG112_14230 [Nocardioides sp. zg-ZUI104]|uniref:WXG100 family type VII secretion target n=1 Tax=Nocardioides faecalis TaxID=2803858 RepID=UPI001BCF14BA|nr:hypothetical protein [Nocardioides faecalis]MBS4753967.1 hypothetical protein [Nocardioides faecalis]
MAGDGSYTLSVEELTQVVDELRDCKRKMRVAAEDLRVQVGRLHEVWDGLSAEAHALAQTSIDDGLAAMGEALQDFIKTTGDAKASYQVAWDTNVGLWQSVLR